MSVKSLLNKLIESLANLAIFIDMIIRGLGKRVFELLPGKLQRNLNTLNESYKTHRNKLLGISETPRVLADSNSKPSSVRNSNSTSKCCGISGSTSQGDNSSDSEECNLDIERSLQRGDVPGWVLVVLMTTGLVTALWTIAAPRLSQILRNSLDSMNSIR